MKLKSWRAEKDLTQIELAEKVGVTPITVHLWEKGEVKPRVDVAIKVCEILGCSVEDVEEFKDV